MECSILRQVVEVSSRHFIASVIKALHCLQKMQYRQTINRGLQSGAAWKRFTKPQRLKK